jgi:hypothetical protein
MLDFADLRTYRELLDRSCRLARYFHDLGLVPGDVPAGDRQSDLAGTVFLYEGRPPTVTRR